MKSSGRVVAFIIAGSFSALILSFKIPGDPIESIRKILTTFTARLPQEKVFVHLDKSSYVAGEDLWFKAYVVSALSFRPSPYSKLVYVELLNGADSVVRKVMLHVTNGAAAGDFKLSDSLAGGRYRLRAYTSWMRNLDQEFYFNQVVTINNISQDSLLSDITYNLVQGRTKDSLKITSRFRKLDGGPASGMPLLISLKNGERVVAKVRGTSSQQGELNLRFPVSSTEKSYTLLILAGSKKSPIVKKFFLPSRPVVDVQFLPEGGSILKGVSNVVAFKAVGPDGQPVEVSGRVIDPEGTVEGTFTSSHAGMGKFSLYAPAPGSYVAEVKTPDGLIRVQLPSVVSSGFNLSSGVASSDSVHLFIKTNGETAEQTAGKTLYLVGQSAGQISYAAKSTFQGNILHAAIPKSKLPAGINQFTLFDSELNALSERLVFVSKPLPYTVQTSDLKSAEPGANLPLSFLVKDGEGKPVTGEYSLSVTDEEVAGSATAPGIYDYLFMTSDLKGQVFDPSYYFFQPTLKKEQDLDLVMMTQGWRRFIWRDLIENKKVYAPYPIELGPEIKGTVTGLFNKPLKKGSVVLMATTKPPLFLTAITGDNGGFVFNGFNIPDSTKIVIQARKQKGGTGVDIKMDEPPLQPVLADLGTKTPSLRAASDKDLPALKRAVTAYAYDRNDPSRRLIRLRNVEVTAQREKKAPYYSSSIGGAGHADYVLFEKDILYATDIYQAIQGRVAGVSVSGQNIRIRGSSNSPAIFLDGVQVSGGLFDDEDISYISPREVSSIEFFKGASAAIYAGGGASGVIVINTKRGGGDFSAVSTPGLLILKSLGIHQAREFYLPKNLSASSDFRSTIFWASNLKADSIGAIKVMIKNTYRSTSCRISLQGIGNNGLPVQYYALYKTGR